MRDKHRISIRKSDFRKVPGSAFLSLSLLACGTASGRNIFLDTLSSDSDPLLSGVLIVSISLIGALLAFVAVPFMWERSSGTRELWQSVCRLERENRRLREGSRNPQASDLKRDDCRSNRGVRMPEFDASSSGIPTAIKNIDTPLTHMINQIQRLMDQELAPEQRAVLESIRTDAATMKSLTTDVLKLLKLDSNITASIETEPQEQSGGGSPAAVTCTVKAPGK